MEKTDSINQRAKVYFAVNLLIALLVFVAFIFLPYSIGTKNFGEAGSHMFFIEEPDSGSYILVWMSGALELMIVVVGLMVVYLAIFGIVKLYNWLWDEAFESAIEDFSKKKLKSKEKKK